MSIASRAIAGVPAACRTLRVLLALGPAVGGMAQHVASLVRGLDRNRFDVAVAGAAEDPPAQAAQSCSCAVHPIRFGSSPLRMTTAAVKLAALVHREGYDIVHAHGYSAAAAAALASRAAPRAKLVCTLHGFLTAATAHPIIGRRARFLLRLIARRAQRITMVSASLRDQLADLPEASAKLVVVPNGIDLAAFAHPDLAHARRELGAPEGAPLVGMVGRLAAQKGPLDFVRAAAVVRQRVPDARFTLIGEGPLRADVEALARGLGLAERLLLAGHRDDAPILTQAFDVAAVASVSEGSSITAMEAMAWARPVAATAVGGVREVVVDGETGVLVPPGDPQALGEAIASLLGDPERARRLGEAGRRRVEREFSLARMIERTEEVYLAVARGTTDGKTTRCA